MVECRSRSTLHRDDLREAISLSQDHLRQLKNASILLTGATGWFGTWLLDYFCAADEMLDLNIRLTAVSRDPAAFLERLCAFREVRLLSWIKSDVRKLAGCGRDFSHVIHAATDSTARPGNSSAREQFDIIVEGTRRALECAGAQCKGFLMVSSGAVYGPAHSDAARYMDGQPGGPDPSLPKSTYAEGKRAAEQLCAIAADQGTPARIARCFAFVGPHMPFDRHFAIGNFIADAVEGRPIQVKSDGRPLRSYLYMSDLVRALLCIMVEGANGRAYNVGSDTALTIKDLADRVNLVVGGRGVVVVGSSSDPSDRYVPDTTRLRTELKFAPAVPLNVAIARTAAWYRDLAARTVP
jgi:nucleoside-diphosphate-sugar epimerase